MKFLTQLYGRRAAVKTTDSQVESESSMSRNTLKAETHLRKTDHNQDETTAPKKTNLEMNEQAI